MPRSVFRAAAWLLVIAILAVTIVPIGMRPHSGLGPEPERVAAFLVLGLLFGLAHERNWMLALGLVVVAGLGIEALQMLSPSRHPTLEDAVIKALAGSVGVSAGCIIAKKGWLGR
ncbi:VanZ family protein [Mesorhizobium sp.]|uniref:VanZ family protein n=1 Tax=Mesorhizobium sp. TaxID=1871066 RepID=UPI001225350C|nr:VanZ family protein [Mesorhizobium sp.]TIO09470.1 MAG: VanZ family protein [Mesorhizobium sp.]TIO29727.1 MAG: VanZ family protein [Mesorhizobium sp.]TIP09438.1 MAG: VanZ family protein [Mesorhizobium sp.]